MLSCLTDGLVQTPVLGQVQKDSAQGSFVSAWDTFAAASASQQVDITAGLEWALLAKDTAAMQRVTEAASLTVRLFRKVLKPKVIEAVEEDKNVKHDVFAQAVTSALDDLPSIGVKSDPATCDLFMLPQVQSGGKYSVGNMHKAAADPNGKLCSDVVILSLGGLCRSYGSCLVRTLMVDPTPTVESTYLTVLEAQTRLINALRPGVRVSDAVREADAHLSANLPQGAVRPKSFGFSVGVKLREGGAAGALTLTNTNQVQAGQVFFVLVAVQDVPLKDGDTKPRCAVSKLKTFAVAVGDTVIAQSADQGAVVATAKAGKELSSVSFELDQGSSGGSGEEDSDVDSAQLAATGAGETGRGMDGRSARLAAKAADQAGDEDAALQRALHQQQLFMDLKNRMRSKLSAGELGQEEDQDEQEVRPIVAYKSVDELPRKVEPTRIFTDKERESVVLPLHGTMVPFHISTIKSVTLNDESGKTYLRVNFYHPGQAVGKDCPPSMAAAVKSNPHLMFIRTLNFACSDPRNMNTQVRLIKELQKRARTRRQEQAEVASLVKQPKLVIDKTMKIPHLSDLNMWPVISGRKCMGGLEAHVNGFRFVSDRREILEIIYANIKHAIFQPCEREHIVLLHFHLHHPIMVGKKKRRDIQFYTDVVEASTALDGKRRSMYDPDEQREEQRERQLRASMNRIFKKFVEKVQVVAESERSDVHSFQFDIPHRDMAFAGVPDKEMVTIMPCTSALVSLSDKPPFVLSLDDIEHVHFERVRFGSKNFDFVLIMKEGARPAQEEQFVRISAVPTTELEPLQVWLDSVVDITYTTGGATLNWKNIINEYVRSPDFWLSEDEGGDRKDVGWAFLAASDDEGEEDEEAESDFDGEDVDVEEEEEADDDEFSDVVGSEDDDDDEEEEEDDDDDEKGLSWEELEKQAMEMDRGHEAGEEDRDERRGTKRGREHGQSSSSGKRSRR